MMKKGGIYTLVFHQILCCKFLSGSQPLQSRYYGSGIVERAERVYRYPESVKVQQGAYFIGKTGSQQQDVVRIMYRRMKGIDFYIGMKVHGYDSDVINCQTYKSFCSRQLRTESRIFSNPALCRGESRNLSAKDSSERCSHQGPSARESRSACV